MPTLSALVQLLTAQLLAPATAGPFNRHSSVTRTCSPGADVGEPLLLSKILNNQDGGAARDASRVTLPGFDHESYSGFLNTDGLGDKEMFFWYFPALELHATAPLVIWLQGGPGGSSMFGLFSEMGPIELDAQLKPHVRNYTWNKKYNMIFIDNPVGAGFSYTASGQGYCSNSKTCVAENLVSLMLQFYRMFPELLSADLYITGESYGGHYVPAFGAKILEHNNKAKIQIPLRGVAVGDGWIDPVNMIPGYPDMMRNMGLASDAETLKIQEYCNQAVNYINAGEMLKAFNVWDEMLNGDVYPYPNYFHNITGSKNYDNFMMTTDPPEFARYGNYVNIPEIRKAIHVGNRTFGGNSAQCEKHLLEDFHQSFRTSLQLLLDAQHVQVLVYSGQLDIIIAASLTERFLPFLQWSGQGEFAAAQKKVWRVTSTDVEVAGFVRECRGFQYVVVRGAGHIVPFDQPRRAYDMIEHFIEGRSYEHRPEPQPVTDSQLFV